MTQDRGAIRAEADKLLADGNAAEALTRYRNLVLQDGIADDQTASDFRNAVQCMQQIQGVKDFDEFLDAAVSVHSGNWKLLSAAADVLLNRIDSYGYMIGGHFERGYHRGGGNNVDASARDRVRSIRLLLRSINLAATDNSATAPERANIHQQLATAVYSGQAWKLQDLTNLEELPEYEEGHGHWFGNPFGGDDKGAPVDADGNPLFHRLPESWNAAESDGERWRWALNRVREIDASRQSEVDLAWADFLQTQFGVAVESPPIVRLDNGQPSEDPFSSARWVLHELSDSETVARLATGPQRMALPQEFNHVEILKNVIARQDDQQRNALEALISVRMNRHQYPQAAELLRRVKSLTEPGEAREAVQSRLDQIVNNWVRIESANTQVAGRGAVLDISIRNGTQVDFEARPVNVDQLLADTQKYLQSRPDTLNRERIQIENIGYMLVRNNRQQYVGDTVANWSVDVDAPTGHFDATTTVSTPLQNAGAYWVTAKMQNGNETHIVLWIADTAVVRKPVESGTLYYAADARTGKPVPNAAVEFFGYRQQREGRTRNFRVLTSRFADRTNRDGICIPTQATQNYQWLTIVRTSDGRMAYDGFSGLWNPRKLNPLSYSPVKVYSITDRPVYRPGHDVKYRLWVRQPRFHQDDAQFANSDFLLQIRNPRGDVIREEQVTTDRWGGIDGTWSAAHDSMLGSYGLVVCRIDAQKTVLGQGSFRVEEYRKPEFQVTVEAPDTPVKLGERIQAKIRADYYFGAPVAEAKIHYKVERTKRDHRWYPTAAWDWLYAPGYWWFAPDYDWYPGWNRWGCFGPIPPWRGWQPDPPEIVAEGDADIQENGTFAIDIDTAPALRDHSDSDHNYTITAEVVDQSRRTITGTGSVLVARDPFKVFVWTNRGHFRTGDTAEIGIQARTPDGKPVSGTGTATLYSVSYENEKPVEQQVAVFDVRTDQKGTAFLKLVLPDAGQFRVSVKIRDDQGHEMEGGYVLYVRGPGNDGRGYRFNDLELIAEHREYSPGDIVRLQVNTNRLDSTVLLFLRPVDGVCPEPVQLDLQGKSTTYEFTVAPADMPNMFVEALTISDGRIHSAMQEIVVPPEERVANVEVVPSAKRYRPGEEATVTLKLTDVHGNPFVGNTVISVYDASLDYIAADRIPEIRAFFWNVRRHHNVQFQSTLDRQSTTTFLPGEVAMQPLYGGWGGFGGGPGTNLGRFSRALGLRGSVPEGGMLGALAAAVAMRSFDSGGDEELSVTVQQTPADIQPAAVEPSIRSEFKDTAFWVASVDSDAAGLVQARFKIPDNLTTWRIRAWTLSDGTRVGQGTSEIISSKDLIIRPQTPRFFTENDLVTLSAVVHNYLDQEKAVTVVLETEGGHLRLLDDAQRTVQIAAGGETRIDWMVEVIASGTATIRMKALTDEESDAAELSVPVQVRGLLKTESYTGVIRAEGNSATIDITVPAERVPDQSRLQIQYSPSLAGAVVDALPYLIEYPYGCTEQTLNRFLPAVLTQRTLQKMGVNLADVQSKRTNLNAQELGDAADRAAEWKRYQRNPVFDEAELERVVRDGVQALSEMQLSDGGWGWFSGYGERSSAHLTAQVVRGLDIAVRNNVPVLPDVIDRSVVWLRNYQLNELNRLKEGDWRREHPEELKQRNKPFKMNADNMDALVAHVLSSHETEPESVKVHDTAMTEYLYRDRESLSVYAKALTGLVLHSAGKTEKRNMILRNIEQVLVKDDENQTAWLRMQGSSWWFWYGSENEAHAFYLKLLLAARPNDETASRLVKYLLNNRKHGTWWNSTRDTALVVEALGDYIAVTNEDQPDMTIEVLVDGVRQKQVKITADNFFSFDNSVVLQGDAVKSGRHRIEIRRSGTGPVYFNAYLTNFTREDPITATGLEVKVRRRFYRLERDDKSVSAHGDRGQVVKQQTAKYKRIPLHNLENVSSGSLIEVELLIDSKNDYEYLMLEDRKPSGFEPDDQRSGYVHDGLRAYRELRDDRVSFFLDQLARGQHSLTYRLRAEMPGRRMSALPATVEGMYAPELVGNSDEFKLRVSEQ